jgi:hypothetical protein
VALDFPIPIASTRLQFQNLSLIRKCAWSSGILYGLGLRQSSEAETQVESRRKGARAERSERERALHSRAAPDCTNCTITGVICFFELLSSTNWRECWLAVVKK